MTAQADALMGIFGYTRRGVQFELPIKTVNPSNGSHGNHFAISSRKKRERKAAYLACPIGLQLPVTVTLTRLSAGKLDAHDNLRSALKSIVDGIADRLGVPDNDPRITWEYQQEKVQKGVYGVRVAIIHRGEE